MVRALRAAREDIDIRGLLTIRTSRIPITKLTACLRRPPAEVRAGAGGARAR